MLFIVVGILLLSNFFLLFKHRKQGKAIQKAMGERVELYKYLSGVAIKLQEYSKLIKTWS